MRCYRKDPASPYAVLAVRVFGSLSRHDMIAVISWRQISTEEPKPWQTQKIETDGTYVIGRARGSFICLEDIRVSRQHVTVERVGDRFHITDHGSANGAFLDGQPFETALWSPGQRLQISDFEFQISFQSVKA
ncbi:MAG: FHA domain-containing protein, partial [Pseudomonadota bacterium]